MRQRTNFTFKNIFVNLKVDWLINNNRLDLIENFLKQNKEFSGKKKAVQYLVDENISQANIKEGCKKIEFIDSTIKAAYLEKFKIYCLVFNDQKPQAQLLLDLLREQNQSDKFFDDKINFLLGISCFYHDSAAVLICDGEIICSVQEERFSRKKHDSRFPKNAIKY